MIDRPVGDVLKGKPSASLFSVASTATVSEAVALMDEKGLGSVLVRDAGGRMAGIFTERDLMRRVVRQGRDPKTTAMSAVMSPEVRQVPASESIVETLRIMVEHGYRLSARCDDRRRSGAG